MTGVQVRAAGVEDVELIHTILLEAEGWLADRGMPMWDPEELDPRRLRDDVVAGMHHLALVGGTPAGTIRYQLEDLEYWPELRGSDEDAYVHRLAVRRSHAGRGVGAALLDWAAAHAAAMGRAYLRLDCDHHRTRLRAFYERNGFRYHSDRQVGRFLVARYVRDLR